MHNEMAQGNNTNARRFVGRWLMIRGKRPMGRGIGALTNATISPVVTVVECIKIQVPKAAESWAIY
jgi:hypothetical protein